MCFRIVDTMAAEICVFKHFCTLKVNKKVKFDCWNFNIIYITLCKMYFYYKYRAYWSYALKSNCEWFDLKFR